MGLSVKSHNPAPSYKHFDYNRSMSPSHKCRADMEKAASTAAESLDVRKRVRGLQHPDTLAARADLASSYEALGRLVEAEELAAQNLETRKKVLGPEHVDTVTSMADLASLHENQGHLEEAKKLKADVLAAKEKLYGPDDPFTLESAASLALTYKKLGQLKDAELLETALFGRREKILGQEHSATLFSMHALARTLQLQRRKDEALSVMTRCYHLRKQVLGPQHPLTEMSQEALIRWRREEEEINPLPSYPVEVRSDAPPDKRDNGPKLFHKPRKPTDQFDKANRRPFGSDCAEESAEPCKRCEQTEKLNDYIRKIDKQMKDERALAEERELARKEGVLEAGYVQAEQLRRQNRKRASILYARLREVASEEHELIELERELKEREIDHKNTLDSLGARQYCIRNLGFCSTARDRNGHRLRADRRATDWNRWDADDMNGLSGDLRS